MGRMAMTRHCWKCGTEYTLPGAPGRSESCHRCNSDLKVCFNCVSYDPRVAQQCRDPAPIWWGKSTWPTTASISSSSGGSLSPGRQSREAKARDTLKKLFGD